MTTKKVLLIGYGNPGRLDDGLGPACAEAVGNLGLPGVSVDADYQLTVEEAADMARYDVVIFADASVNGAEPFEFTQIGHCADVSFSTHSVEPEALMAMAHDMFEARTKGFALAIRGYEFNEFGEGLCDAARKNMEQAVAFIADVITEDTFEHYESGKAGSSEGQPAVVLTITQADMN